MGDRGNEIRVAVCCVAIFQLFDGTLFSSFCGGVLSSQETFGCLRNQSLNRRLPFLSGG